MASRFIYEIVPKAPIATIYSATLGVITFLRFRPCATRVPLEKERTPNQRVYSEIEKINKNSHHSDAGNRTLGPRTFIIVRISNVDHYTTSDLKSVARSDGGFDVKKA